MGLLRNQRGNEKIHEDKYKWKHIGPKPSGIAKAVLRGKFIAIQSYFKKKKISNNLTLYLKELEKE